MNICICTTCMQYPQSLEEDIRTPGIEVTHAAMWKPGNEPRSSTGQQTLKNNY